MRPAQLHPKGQHGHPQRVLKDRSTFPTYHTRVELQILTKVLQLHSLKVASSECLPHRTYYLIYQELSKCWNYF
jgi:hypothetical protein